jgi:hypothetical protein
VYAGCDAIAVLTTVLEQLGVPDTGHVGHHGPEEVTA